MRKRIQREDKEMTDYTTTAAGLVRKARRRGVTLIEAVLFISIALGLIVGGLVFFQQASLAQRTADAVRNISALASETRALYQSSTYFDGATESVLINAGAVPSNIINGNELQNGWGGDIVMWPSDEDGAHVATNATHFTIAMTDLPSEPCVRLGPVGDDNTGIVGSGITAVHIAPTLTTADGTGAPNWTANTNVFLAASTAARLCSATNTVALGWTFGR
jgi:hypothetical protein